MHIVSAINGHRHNRHHLKRIIRTDLQPMNIHIRIRRGGRDHAECADVREDIVGRCKVFIKRGSCSSLQLILNRITDETGVMRE